MRSLYCPLINSDGSSRSDLPHKSCMPNMKEIARLPKLRSLTLIGLPEIQGYQDFLDLLNFSIDHGNSRPNTINLLECQMSYRCIATLWEALLSIKSVAQADAKAPISIQITEYITMRKPCNDTESLEKIKDLLRAFRLANKDAKLVY